MTEATGQPGPPPLVRRADSRDLTALVHLRAVMLGAMASGDAQADVPDVAGPWATATRDWFAAQLATPDRFAAFVVDEPGRGAVSVAVGSLRSAPPRLGSLETERGHVFNVATDLDRRRRGYARTCMTALLDWFRTGTPAPAVELHATSEGIGLYRSLGFTESAYPQLRLRLDDA